MSSQNETGVVCCNATGRSFPLLAWLAAACAGFAMMAWSYFGYQRIDETTPWAFGLLYLADRETPEPSPPLGIQAISAPVRRLAMSPTTEAIVRGLSSPKRDFVAVLSEKLLLLAPQDAGITEDLLARGRLPTPGRDEVLAGYWASHKDVLPVDGRQFRVVGVLRRDAASLARVYLLPPPELPNGPFHAGDAAVRKAIFLRLTPEQAHDSTIRESFEAAYPPDRLVANFAMVRADSGPYHLYLAGLTLLLLGGSGCLIRLYAILAMKVRWAALRTPLEELVRRRRLLWAIHIGYFGATILAALVIYNAPEVQSALLSLVRGEIHDGRGVLGVAGKAYLTRNIAIAAAVTLGINFVVGSLLFITLPSAIVPGIGVLGAAFRALIWGVLLAPSFNLLALVMLPHSWTLLLEGEGYILATFFALLIPVLMCRRDMGGGVLRRYGRALSLNAQGALVTFIVLAVAACYEAVEVILMAGR